MRDGDDDPPAAGACREPVGGQVRSIHDLVAGSESQAERPSSERELESASIPVKRSGYLRNKLISLLCNQPLPEAS